MDVVKTPHGIWPSPFLHTEKRIYSNARRSRESPRVLDIALRNLGAAG
jgi:hypothetical protein